MSLELCFLFTAGQSHWNISPADATVIGIFPLLLRLSHWNISPTAATVRHWNISPTDWNISPSAATVLQ